MDPRISYQDDRLNYYHAPRPQPKSKWRERWEDFKDYAPYIGLSMIFFAGACLMGTALGDSIAAAINGFFEEDTFTAKWVYVYEVFDPRRWF